MKKNNLVRNLLMVALLAAGICATGVENRSFAQERGGYINASGATNGGGGMGSGTYSTSSSGLLNGGGRSDGGGAMGSGTLSASGVQTESEGILASIWAFFF